MEERADASRFVLTAGSLWREATTSPFLEAAGDGSLPPERFGRWLVQDHHFAVGLTAFEGILAARLARPAQSAIIAGLGAMDSELSWFESEARARGLDLAGPVRTATRRYVDFLLAAVHEDSTAGLLAALYGVEVSYLAAWSALAAAGPYSDAISRWSSDPFRRYVLRLKAFAEAAPDPSSQPLFDEVLRHEREFWAMAWSG